MATQKKKAATLYGALLEFYFQNGRPALTFDDKPFFNFLDVLCPFVCKEDYFCYELFVSAVEWHLESLENKPTAVGEAEIDAIVAYIARIFQINKEKHWLVFPLQGSGLKKDIAFSQFHILKEKEEPELVKQISSIADIDEKEVAAFLEHTKRM